MNPFFQLVRPWAYLVIRGNQKSFFDWVAPLALAAVSLVVILVSAHQVNFYGAGGCVAAATSFIQNLPGFFIAALAAIATFNRSDLDQLLPAPTPTIPVQARGSWSPVKLTRRRFLSVLFSFLTVQSVFLTLLGIAYQQLSPWIISVAPPLSVPFVAAAGAFFYFFVLWQLITVTCLGLYYLGDRIHQPEDS